MDKYAYSATNDDPRELAKRLECDGFAPLRADHGMARRLERALNDARGLSGRGVEGGEALRQLSRDARLWDALVDRLRDARRTAPRLPAYRGTPRVLILAEALVGTGEAPLDDERLTRAVRSFDAAQCLTQRELWLVPDAVRVAVLGACARTAECVVRAGRDGERAERWVRDPRRRLPGDPSPAFFEHALRLAGENELPEARVWLEKRLRARGLSADQVVRQAHAARALDRVRLENLMASRRMVDAIDWRRRFEELSAVERELRRDPSGVYPLMDDASKRQVRDAVSELARASGVDEATIARAAVAACSTDGAEPPADIDALSREPFDSETSLERCACYWLYDDAGRRALLNRLHCPNARPRRLVPDPTGRGCVAALTALAAALFALLARWTGSPAAWPSCLILAWTGADRLAAKLAPRVAKPARLLKLGLPHVPDAWRTLVVTPVLLGDPARADAACDNLEVLGSLDDDENLACLLLGDFADADAEALPGDGEILARVRERVAEMNARAGREKYFYLHRPRTRLESDNRWMGLDRKRGALMALNRVLLDEPGAADAFAAEGAACAKLAGRFRFVVTLDADTRLLPETLRELIGAMAHPLNRRIGRRGYAVMQPRMELMPAACVNAFARLTSGSGGVDAYPVAASSLWMDLTGVGAYAGKGIYDVAAFHAALDGALPEGRVLSHDLIEGAIARAAFLGDVALYDGCPATLGGWLRRAHRWTRGDWQLVPFIFRKALPNGRRLSAADRFRMLDNLARSLRDPALLLLLLPCAWTGDARALAAGLLAAFFSPILNLFHHDPLAWRRATAALACLPLTALNSADAALRALWRGFVSGRRLMDWVPSADAESGAPDRRVRLPGAVAALLALPGLFIPGARLPAAALALLFGVGTGWVRGMEDAPAAPTESLDEADIPYLAGVARDTWRFFEDCVPFDGTRPIGAALPPDNVQLDPPAEPVRRTSPTNIGLYLLSCVAAHRLGFIGMAELRARAGAALDAVERAEKWRGHLFNWMDIDTLEALRPRYVSSVDSGNLAACALACASALAEADGALAGRFRALASGMDFAALYDGERELFRIGMDVDHGLPSRSHYDLMASESRILSFTAIRLNQVSARHWRRLGRARADGSRALVSWSGTMFEYLMPDILMRAPELTLLGESRRAAVDRQIARGVRLKLPWGVSESGLHAFDMHMNYQYRAFGLRSLALDAEGTSDGVVAPYAAALALAARPATATADLRAMEALGWRGERGFYEAADYLRPGPDGAPSIVYSHMAHHQGMALCAVCNALTGDSLARDFMRDPRARALELLLQERPGPAPRRRSRRAKPDIPISAPAADTGRSARPDGRIGDCHLLSGRRSAAIVTADGGVHYWRGGVDATRLHQGLLSRRDAARLYLRDEVTGLSTAPGGPGVRARFDAGEARFEMALGMVEARARVSLSPEDDTLFVSVTLKNHGTAPARVRIVHVAPAALADRDAMRAHAIFHNLFMEASRLGECGLALRRRPRDPDEAHPLLLHMARSSEPVAFEADGEYLLGRTGATPEPGDLRPLRSVAGCMPDPVSALGTRAEVAPGEMVRMHFALALWDGDPEAWLERCLHPELPSRAAQLSRARTEAMLGYLGLSAAQYHLLARTSALLVDPRLAMLAKPQGADATPSPREALWPLGMSGDRPIALLTLTDAAHDGCVRALLRAHAFFRAMGVPIDLALVDDCLNGYGRPGRDLLDRLIESGGVWVFDGASLAPAQRAALERSAAIALQSGAELFAQLRACLSRLDIPSAPAPRPLALGANRLEAPDRSMDNGFGGFVENGYEIDVGPDLATPAPWCDILASEGIGALLTERGGGFIWHGNSRFNRLTPYRGDALWEGWGLMLFLHNPGTGERLRLLPGDRPQAAFRVRFSPDCARYRFDADRLAGEVAFALDDGGEALLIDIRLDDHALAGRWRVTCVVDWLMGADATDTPRLRAWFADGACFATGAADGVGWLTCDAPGATHGPELATLVGRGTIADPEWLDAPASDGGSCLRAPVELTPGTHRLRFAVGWSEDLARAKRAVRRVGARVPARAPEPVITVETPDPAVNAMANTFLLHQVRAARVLGRTGLCQPGGAFGFRDQLQDMLALIPSEPARVRAHLLACAARQFESGDAMHWWHAPFLGVRTRISDDRLFLPWTTAAYVAQTGDASVLNETVPYLADEPIPEDREDIYREMRPGDAVDTLHDHCMRAFRSVKTGAHGLALMGSGDWNDGMNRVGAKGRGESVWLSEFVAACADAYAEVIADPGDRAWLRGLARAHRKAVEAHGWDGAWYRRAYFDDGSLLGSWSGDACRIDLVTQAWAVLARLDGMRAKRAMNSAWERLVDEDSGVIRLIDPPFDGEGSLDPGYIRGYPAGVRENGAQYTHAACWALIALIRQGDAERAHRALDMLLPPNHALDEEAVERYRAEPFAMAGDVWSAPGREGRGGWTWYTGSAAWMYLAILEMLGYERRGDRVRLCPLLGPWDEAAVTVRFGKSRWRLSSDRRARSVTLDGEAVDGDFIRMVDDGQAHEARFPAR